MELESDLSKIQSEELLRKMWQQSEDTNRKKEIRSQLYKLRESRLRDLYQFDIMSDNRVSGFGKDPMAPSHGESLADQSFQSLKTKEIRDSMSPTEMKFQSMALNNPSTTGWNVQSSSEVSPDGRGFRAETVATTDGVENINGGTAEFKGRNEQRSSAMHEGDDKNFMKKASESSNTHLQEKVVIGDENSGRTEVRTSSSTSTSSSKVFQSSSTTDYENGQPVDYHPQYLMDSNRAPQRMQEPPRMQEPQRMPEPQYYQRPSQYEPQNPQEVRRSLDQQFGQQTEQYNRNVHEKNTSQNVETNEKHEQNKRYVDVDKASPEYQKQVQYLMSQPGEIISNTVEYPKPNVKMITTVKRLPDGTIVRNKRYETEETTPTPTPSYTNNTRQTVSNNNTQRRDSQTSQPSKNYQGHPPSERLRRPNDDVVDNVETRYTHDDNVSNVETKYSTVKTSNRKFSTQTTSETIQESDDSHYPTAPGGSRPKPVTNDFSTHGFPSVRPNKPTQEFASDRPQSVRPNQGSPSQNMTSPRDALIPARGEFEPTITERRIPTEDGEVIIVSSEKKRNVKHQTNSERIIETDVRTSDDNRRQQISDVTTTSTNQDFSTHGFPSVKEPQAHPKTFPDNMYGSPHDPTPGYPANARPTPSNTSYAPAPNDDGVVVTSQKSHTAKHSTNTERIIETEILGDDGRPRPRPPAGVEYITNKYTVTTPGDQVPQHEFPAVSSQTPGRDHPTQGFPSVRSPTKATTDYSTQGFPSARDAPKPSANSQRPQSSPIKNQTPSPSTRKPNSTVEATERVIQKEKEVDAAHRAFAASLRSSSPVDSYSTDGPRHTPRSSVSSTKTFKRDMREGSHDSAAGSETSRLSTTTVTRQTPPRTVGGKTVVTKQTVVTTKNNQGSSERINVTSSPRGTKSPSPGKTVTTTTTTRTVTSKAPLKDVPKSDNQHTTTTTTTTDTIFPINHDSLTITKKNISDNQSNNKMPLREVVEEPCIKKHYYLLGPSDHTTTAHKQEPSPRSSPAPSSRSSPYPSKSKSPLGEDDQSIKTHTSRPLSPSFTSRSPKPIGSKDVPNSRDHPHQRPTNVVPVDSDERRTVDREQHDRTSTATRRKPSRDTNSPSRVEDDVFITEDYLQEDVDATQNLKTKTKQLITHEKEPHRPSKPGMAKTTRSPQRTDRPEEPKRNRITDQTSPSGNIAKQPLAPKSTVPSKPVTSTERRTQPSPKAAPSTQTQSPKKSQPRPSDKTPRVGGNERPYIPRSGSPGRDYPSGDEDEPRETSEITIQTSNRNVKKTQKEIDELIQADYSPRPTKPSPKHGKPQPLSQPKTPKHTGDERPNSQRRGSPDRVYPSEIEQEPTLKSGKPHPRAGDVPKNKTPKNTADDRPYNPRGGSPDREYPSDIDEETSELVIQTSTRKLKTQKEIDEVVRGDYTKRSTEPRTGHIPQNKTPKQIDDEKPYIPRRGSPDRVYPSEIEYEPNARRPVKSQPGAGDVPKNKTPKHTGDERPYIPRSGSPDRQYPSDIDEETTEVVIQTSTVNKTQKQIDELVQDDYTLRPTQPRSGDTPKHIDDEKPYTPSRGSPDRVYPSDTKGATKPTSKQGKPQPQGDIPKNKTPKQTGDERPYTPRSGSPEREYPSDDEPRTANLRETSEITIQTSNRNLKKTQKEIEESVYDDYTTRVTKPGDLPQNKTPKQIGDEKPHIPVRGSPDRVYPTGNEDEPTSQKQRTSEVPKTKTTKHFDDKYIPRSCLPDREYPSENEDEPRTADMRETSEITIQTSKTNLMKTQREIDELVQDDYTSRPSTQQPKISETVQGQPKPRDFSNDKEPKSSGSPQRPGQRVPKTIDNSDVKGPTRHPKDEPIRREPKGTDYSDDKEPLGNIPKTSKPNIFEPTTTVHERFIDAERAHPELQKPTSQQPKSYAPTQKEPKPNDYADIKEPTSSPTKQQPKAYEPSDKDTFKTTSKMYVRNDETEDITKKNTTSTIHEQFMEAERAHPEHPDGGFVSKTPKEPSPSPYPTFTKKGTGRSDTFEDRCRQILGMETYGDTPGAFKKRPIGEVELLQEDDQNVQTNTENVKKTTFEVKIEDCGDDDDDEPLSINSVKENLVVKKVPKPDETTEHTEIHKGPVGNKPYVVESFETTENVYTTSGSEPETTRPKDTFNETVEVTKKRTQNTDSDVTKKPSSKSPTKSDSPTFGSQKDILYETVEETNERTGKTVFDVKKKPTSKSPTRGPTSGSPKDVSYETIEVTNKRIQKSDTDVTKKTTSRSPTRSQPTFESPKRQPTKTDSTTKPTTQIRKEPLRNEPDWDEGFVITTEQVYVVEGKTVYPDSEPKTTRPKDTSYEIKEVTKKQTGKSVIDVTKKPTSKSPTRSQPTFESPKRQPTKTDSTTRKPTSPSRKEPLRNKPNEDGTIIRTTEKVYVVEGKQVLPDTASDSEPEETSYETTLVTKKRTDKSVIDVTKKPTSRSPTRPVKPTSDSPKRQPIKADLTTKPTTPSRKEPLRNKPNGDESFVRTTEKVYVVEGTHILPDTGSDSEPETSRPKDTCYETTEVTKKRTDKSVIDVTKKTTSRSPTRPVESSKRQPIKADLTTKPTTPSRKEPLRNKPNVEDSFVTTTEKVYVVEGKIVVPDTGSDSEPETLRPKDTCYETAEVTKKRTDKSAMDVTKKTTSRSPTRPVESPKRQPIKADLTTKPTTPSRKEPLRNRPNVEDSFVRTTEKVYVVGGKKVLPDTATDSEPETLRPTDTCYETTEVTKKRSEKNIDITRKPTSRSPIKPVSPTRKPTKTTDLPNKTSTKPTNRDDTVTETTSIRDRLRSSVRKEKSPKKPDQVDAGSSPESSPTRHTERRRSSNISVNTEIIIDHTETEMTFKKPEGTPRKPKDSVFREIIDSTTLPDKMPRKMPVTERKESAPVHRVTRKDKDSKMARSTSENLIKVVKKPETITTSTLTPPSAKMSPKPSADHRRPNKCFATKTINLSTTDRLVNSADMENVIIDIQHAKSSREPSPDKIVPTPVPAHFDTGKPRYPDVVQEPEDEPRRKPVIKNIPIFEEEHNTYVGCHITEVNRKTYDHSDYREDDVLSTPVVEAPPSLDYPTYPNDVPDDECLLSVHDKVSKFQHIAEEVKKPKSSSPFNREYDDVTRVPDDDECLLTVDEKVDKFIKTAENLTSQVITPTPTRDTPRRAFIDETDEDVETTECTFTSVKLAPTAPQRSPELVRHISRHISRQSDVGEPTEPKHTHEPHEEYVSERPVEEFVTHRQTSAVIQPQQQQQQRRPIDDDDDDDNEELIPHTATHTTRLEERRQKDILTRPSVFDNKATGSRKPQQQQPTNRVNKTQPKYVSPTPKDSEKSSNQPRQQAQAQPQLRPQVKSRAKPETPKQTATTTITSTATSTTTSTNKRQPQSPQRRRVHPDTDCDYRGSNVETSVISSTTNKQTKPYSINGPKKSPQPQPQSLPAAVNKKRPDRQSPSPLHTNKTKNLKHDGNGDDDNDDDYDVDYEEFEVEVVPNDSETELIINSDTARRSTTTKTIKATTTNTGKTNVRKEPTQQHTSPTTRKMKEIPGSTSSSPSSPTKNTKAHVVNLTERSTPKYNTTTTNMTATKSTIDNKKSSETNESFLENRPPTKKTPTPYPQKTKSITTTDSVAARRSLFENHHNTPKPSSTRPTPTSSPSTGRRPSYMDHTKSSLEHIRRDSLELNKTNYSRRPSGEYDELHPTERNTQVKFDVPQKLRQELLHIESEEDINIEEIFELVILERLLETVTSYELRRRIRAQIRLVKRNLSNVERNIKDETVTTTTKTNHRGRSNSRDSKTKASTHVTTKKHYTYKEEHEEEERRSSSTHTSPERTQIRITKVTRTHSPESKHTSSHSERSLSPQQKPSQVRVCSKQHHHDRSPSPDTKIGRKEFSLREETSKKQYIYNSDEVERIERTHKETSPTPRRANKYPHEDDEDDVEHSKGTSPTARRPSRKSPSPHSSSPERHQVDTTHRVTDRSSSPKEKKPTQARVYSKSPENKVSSVNKPSDRYEQSVTVKQQKRTPALNAPKAKPEQKAPVWADRKNVLKTPGTTTTTTTSTTTSRKPATVTDSRTSSLSRTVKSSTTNQSQRHVTNKSSYVEDDCITSSYGIGPTDENGLPLFGIRALKKKKPTSEPCETTEEVTGYVVEEKYYSDNKSKPIVERKELIYSTNPEELNAIKEKVQETAVRSIKSQNMEDIEEPRSKNSTYKTKTTTSVRSSPEEFLESSTTKYVRRGSVKEMSEKFIQKESSSAVTEKVNNYPKAGLILRTNSRKHSRDNDAMDGDEDFEYYESRTLQRDSEEDDECQVAVSGHFIVDSESESESIKKTQREFKQITSTKSSSSRSFLNTKGEQKVVTSVDDVLDRMRNADNVVEEGDTAEDQEARALLNKFLGASIIMKGVESAIPMNRETKMITTTSTGSGKQPAKHEVKTTRVTKTIKSGSSSSPVIETTCDIEEIWDEEILKQLLEQAKTYEERRKIRSRLRELMADRAEKNSCPQTGKEEEEEAASTAGAIADDQSNDQRSESSASEYEEIIEEVTDYSCDSDEAETTTKTASKDCDQSKVVVEEKKNSVIPPPDVIPDKSSQEEQTKNTEEDVATASADSKSEKETEIEPETEKETETLNKPNDITDSSEQDAKQQQSSTSTTEKTETKGRDGAVVTTTTKVTTRTVSGTGPKTVSPFAKFKQLDRQNSQQSTKSPTTPTTPGGGSSASPSATGNAPIFKFTDPGLNARAATVKDQLLQWCQSKTTEYENVQITNFSACWVDGLAFCALIHHFLPDAFDYSQLTPQNRRKNFELAFTVADEKAGIAPLLDVEDMVVMKRPDWKCVFVYVQSIYRRFRNCQ